MRAALALLLLSLARVYGGQDFESTYYLAEGPNVTIPPSKPPSPTEVAHIRSLIDGLATLDHMSGFLYQASTFKGLTPFSPVPLEQFPGEEAKTSSAVRAFDELVKLGPTAIPFLLEALTNATPTRLTVEKGGGDMMSDKWLCLNFASPRELSVRNRLLQGGAVAEFLERHTISVGDVCFAALGQIVGRNYSPVTFRHTLCIGVTSPTHSPFISEHLKSIWSDADPTSLLLSSLVRDLRVRARHVWSFDGCTVFAASYLQCGAIRRLLYYFPEQGVPLVVARIDDLNRGWVFTKRMSEKRFFQESVIHEQLLDVCARFPTPEVQAAVARYHRRKAVDNATILAAPHLLGAGLAAGIVIGWRRLRRRRRPQAS